MTTTARSETAYVPASLPVRSQRLVSLDALRGFDMFWIVGGEGLFQTLANLLRHARPQWHGAIRAADFAVKQLDHKPWAGFGFYDLIFPMFVFMVGASLVFSLSKLMAVAGRRAAVRRVVVRSVVLYLFGILYYLTGDPQHLRLMGVLQRIALAYLCAGLMFCFLRPRALVGVCVGLLVAYWAVMSFVPAPGNAGVSFDEGQNLANWIDAHYLPFYKWDGNHDPEGILSTAPAVASCLLGVFAGLLLRNGRSMPRDKALMLMAAGLAVVALGFLWGLQFPVVKKLWTSSFVLVAGGYSALLLGVFYLVIDVWNVRGWAVPFVWIGMNPITLYLAEHFLNFRGIADRFFGGEFARNVLRLPAPPAPDANFLAAAGAVGLMFLLAWFLYSRKVFLRV